MYLDPRTALVVGALMSLSLGLLLATVRRGMPPVLRQPLQLWLRGSLLLPAGFLLLALRGTVPDLLSILLANVLIVGAFGDFCCALYRLRESSPPRFLMPVALSSIIASCLVFTYAVDSIQIRTVVVSLILAALSLLSARALLRGAPTQRPAAQAAGVVIFLFSTGLMLTRASLTILWPDSAAGMLEARPLQVTVFVTGALVPVLASYCFLLLCTDRMREEIERGAALDFLTGILNRGGIEQAGGRIFARSRRHGSRCAAIVIDVDYFKRINDAHGHAVGDQALQVCVDRLLSQLREEDTLGRLGGEEFLLLLEDTTEEQAMKMAERLRMALAERPLALETGLHPSTISLGVALLGPDDFSFSDLLRRADRALYAAKDAGRNRVQLAVVRSADQAGLCPDAGRASSLS